MLVLLFLFVALLAAGVASFATYRALRGALWRAELDAIIYHQLARDLERGIERNVEPKVAIWILRPAFLGAGLQSDVLERIKQSNP